MDPGFRRDDGTGSSNVMSNGLACISSAIPALNSHPTPSHRHPGESRDPLNRIRRAAGATLHRSDGSRDDGTGSSNVVSNGLACISSVIPALNSRPTHSHRHRGESRDPLNRLLRVALRCCVNLVDPGFRRDDEWGVPRDARYIPQRSAAVCTGASQYFVISSSSAVTVSEQPAMSSEVT